MKKNMKKALIIMAVVITAMLMLTFVSSAVTDCGDGKHLINTRVIEPTCETDGYTESFCTVCEKVLGTSDHKAALGHDYDNAEWSYHEDGDHFVYQASCARDCGAVKNDGKIYYTVDFINPWAVDTYCEDVWYAKLAETHKEVEVASAFVAAGECAQSPEVTVTRIKDKAYGRYIFAGWTAAKTDSEEALGAVIDLAATPITENTEFFAAFTADKEVTYQVQFHNANNASLTRYITVRHGQKADDDIFKPQGVDENGDIIYLKPPTMDDSNRYYYVFKTWNLDINHIYGNTEIVAVYYENPRIYEYVFCDFNGNPLGDEYTEAVIYGGRSKFYSDSSFEALMARPKDRTYIYAWMGGFTAKESIHQTSVNSLTPPAGALDTRFKDESNYKPIELIPQYVKNLVDYEFDLTAVIPASEKDPEYYLDKILVNIVNSSGQLVATGMTQNVNGKAIFKCSVNDSIYFDITAVTLDEKYSGSKRLERNFIYDPTYTKISTTINLEISESFIAGTHCGCLHHNTLIRPIWVRILNLLYRFFNVKYACCDDMYATIGDLLIYTK